MRIIREFVHSSMIAHWVNRAKITDESYQLVVKHFDRPGVLAAILAVIRETEINVDEVENIIFDGGIAACCTMKLKSAVPHDSLERIKENPNVLSVSYVAI